MEYATSTFFAVNENGVIITQDSGSLIFILGFVLFFQVVIFCGLLFNTFFRK